MDTEIINRILSLNEQILSHQSNLYSNMITTFIGLTVLLVGCTWLWNFVFAKKQIIEQIEVTFAKYQSAFQSRIKNLVDESVHDSSKTLIESTLMTHADMTRMSAATCMQANQHAAAIDWILSSLKSTLSIESEKDATARQTRICVEMLLQCSQMQPAVASLRKEQINDIVETLKTVPETLYTEKRDILKNLGRS